jgi:uncharacterized protein
LAINFSGEFTTPRSPEEVFDFLSDPNRFAPLLPDYQSMSMQDATHFTVKVKVGVGNIRGSAELKMELTEAVKPQRAQYKGQGTAVGSQVNVIAGFDLEPNGATTKVLWNGETSVFGKLASMAGGMLEPLGRKNIQKLIEGLQKALSEPVAAQPPSPSADALMARPTNGEETPSPAAVEAPESATPVEAPTFSSVNDDTNSEGASAPVPETHGNETA